MSNLIKNEILKIPRNNWESLFKLIPKIEQCRDFGRMKGGEKIAKNVSLMPYMEPTEIVSEYLKTVYENKIILSFDWADWKEGQEMLNSERIDYSQLDFETLAKLLITLTRADRFNEGFLVSCFEKGIVLKIIKEMKNRHTESSKIYLQDILPLNLMSKEGNVLLVRHSHKQLTEMIRDGVVEEYQSYQSKPSFKNCSTIVSFVAQPKNHAKLFGVFTNVGIKEDKDVPKASQELVPYYTPSPENFFLELERKTEFKKYENRLVIDWISPSNAWFNNYGGDIKNKEVVRIVPESFVMEMPSLLKIRLTHYELKKIIDNPDSHSIWFDTLQRIQAVYLITEMNTGKQYVGTTYGEHGLWQRWNNYVGGDCTGGNTQLKDLCQHDSDFYKNFQFSILEVLTKNASKDDCLSAEKSWKEKLGSKAFGLNSN